MNAGGTGLRIVDPHRFQCGSGSRDFITKIVNFYSWKKSKFLKQKCSIFIHRLQWSTMSIRHFNKYEICPLFSFIFGPMCPPSWIQIRSMPTKFNTDPCGSRSATLEKIGIFNKPASKSKRMSEPRLCPTKETSPEKPGFLSPTKGQPVIKFCQEKLCLAKKSRWKSLCSRSADPDPIFNMMRTRIQLTAFLRIPDEDSDPASRNDEGPYRSEFAILVETIF